MRTNIKTITLSHRTCAGLAAAALVAVGTATAPMAAGEHSGGHGHEPGHEKGHADTGKGHGHDFAFGKPGKASEVDRTIDVAMYDIYYDPKAITVKAGETVRFKVHNKGTLLHEFGLGTAAVHKKHQKQMAVMMEHGMIEADRINRERMKMEHDKMEMMSHDDPNSILLEPGKSGEIVWTFTKAMDIEFACNVPGHYESGMVGPVKFEK